MGSLSVGKRTCSYEEGRVMQIPSWSEFKELWSELKRICSEYIAERGMVPDYNGRIPPPPRPHFKPPKGSIAEAAQNLDKASEVSKTIGRTKEAEAIHVAAKAMATAGFSTHQFVEAYKRASKAGANLKVVLVKEEIKDFEKLTMGIIIGIGTSILIQELSN